MVKIQIDKGLLVPRLISTKDFERMCQVVTMGDDDVRTIGTLVGPAGEAEILLEEEKGRPEKLFLLGDGWFICRVISDLKEDRTAELSIQ